MKILVIQDEGSSRDKLVQFLEAGGAEVIASRPVWPGFFHVAKDERPDIAVVDCTEPGPGREVAGYLGETGFTRQIKVLAINASPDRLERLKQRAPRARAVNLDDLADALRSINPDFGNSD